MLAHAAADRYLGLLESIYGHGHLHTHFGMYAKMYASQAVGHHPWHVCSPCDFDACHRCYGSLAAAGRQVHEHALMQQDPTLAEEGRTCDLCHASNDQGDIHLAIYWANRAVAILTAASGGAPTAELANAYEMVAWLLLNPGPNFNLAASEKMAAHALGLRRACGADESPNETLQESVGEWKESRDKGEIDARGLAVGVAMGAAIADAADDDSGDGAEAADDDGGDGGDDGGDGEGGGVLGTIYNAVSDAVGEEGATLTDKIKEQLTVENLEKVVDFFAKFF